VRTVVFHCPISREELSVEPRLLPLNGLLTLVTRGDINRPVLAEAGFRVVGLEIPVVGTGGKAVIDILLFREATNHLVQCESKSGANIDAPQAKAYAGLSASSVVQAAYVTLPRRVQPTLETLYVCLDEHVDRIRLGLQKAGLPFPVLAVSALGVELHDEGFASVDLREPLVGPVTFEVPPLRIIPFDPDSSAGDIERYVRAALVALLSARTSQISLTGLAEKVAGHYALYGQAAQQKLKRKVGVAVTACVRSAPGSFAYEAPTGVRPEGVIRFLKTPEDLDRRGRTQAYQALGRPKTTRRARQRVVDPNQLDLFAELDMADTGDEDSFVAEEEEGQS
jgi:hypothetical protein